MGLPNNLPHFDCAAPQKFDRSMLALALAFNDLKGLLLFHWWMKEHPPVDVTSPTAYRGQFAGIQNQLNRIAAGVAHETLRLIKEHKNTIKSLKFSEVVNHLSSDNNVEYSARRCWDRLVQLAMDGNDATARALQRVRDQAAFHYYHPKTLARCYVERFRKSEGQPAPQSKGFVSLGRSMERTRHYYADAAAEELVTSAGEQQGIEDYGGELEEVVRTINFAVGPLLEAHIYHKLGLKAEDREATTSE